MSSNVALRPLLTKRETAELLRVSPRTLERLVAAEVLRPVVFVPRVRWRFRAQDVERIVAGVER